MGRMNWKRQTAIKGAMHHAKTSFSTETFGGALISVVQYLAPLWCVAVGRRASVPLHSGSRTDSWLTPTATSLLCD
jgi:hypothetical protein